ncbi:MAG: T9SS type A sorting domain-containing protein [Muribaculaceae bacterium]|nr:T9SS type A sorting domain-containing protein [Muribaculaceae bacterium]
MKKYILAMAIMLTAVAAQAKTLIVYYSYTNNVERIVTELRNQIEADAVEIEPAEKGLNYAANNYAIGSAQIAAIRNNPNDVASYPAIDPVSVDLSQYSTIIIGAPLWWSNMAAPLQTFLFQHGAEMSGKNIGLIVSSASSGISGVESDAKRLIPDGKFLTPSLWIRSSQTSNAPALISEWLKAIEYENLAGIESVASDYATDKDMAIYNLSGQRIAGPENLPKGIYIVKYKDDNMIQTKKIML